MCDFVRQSLKLVIIVVERKNLNITNKMMNLIVLIVRKCK